MSEPATGMTPGRSRLRDQVVEELRVMGIDDPYGDDARALLGEGWALVFEEDPVVVLREVQELVDQANTRMVGGGEVRVIMRRVDALREAIAQRGRSNRKAAQVDLEFCFDQVLRALTKTFGLPR